MNGTAFTSPLGHLRLFFDGEHRKKIAGSLSAVEQIGQTVWLAGDESHSIERLISTDEANFKDHTSFDLADFFPLPTTEKDDEIDLEGLCWDKDDERLWLTGSHSWRRKQPRPDSTDEEAFGRLKTVDRQANRYLLGSIQLREDAVRKGIWTPVPQSGQALPFTADGNTLTDLLADNVLLGDYMTLPSKDNGFDVEGIAAKNGHVLLGLRGPVLRGWASVLHCRFEADTGGKLAPQPNGARPCLHHILDLDGLGVRDLCFCDDDVLILAGPTMSLDGPIRVFRWRKPFDLTSDARIDGARLERLFNVPWGERVDHAEGITIFKRENHPPRLLVVYDSPDQGRLHDGVYFEADLFRLPD